MAVTDFEKNIKSLNFSFKKIKDEPGILLTENYKKNIKISPQELFALETAKEKFEADAVYFRYFNDGRGAIPQIYIYDNTGNHLTAEEKKNIHIKVWSGCQVPMFIIIEKAEVKVFDAREKVKQHIENHAFETIKLTGSVIEQFAGKSFDDGLFWEEETTENKFQFATSAYRDLISGLKNVYIDFQKTSDLNAHVALKLLVQCLLIKYLEERDEQSETGYFAKTYFKRNFSCNNFCAVIRSGKLLNLLDKLAEDFNGRIFEWDKKNEKDQRKAVSQSKVQKLADYLDGNIQNDQFVLWRLYSFSSLPVELISSVYEELLTNSKDIVYTPEMIVSTLVDECMPLKSPKQNFKLIDVSCGSGIFLVKAYKRIIQWWRYEQWKDTGNLVKPSLTTLKQLLTYSIYGRDVEGDAISLTVFSLSLALLDEVDLDPPTWQKLKFPDLSANNIVEYDFFKFLTNHPPHDFDLVIGNPPFNPPRKDEKEQSKGEYFGNLKKKYGYNSEIKIPYNNPALHFLVQAMKLLKQDALLCLIQPSGPLMYQSDQDFKTTFFSQYNLLQIIDFTKLSDVLWGKKNIATAAIFLQNAPPDNESVVHVVANRTFSNLNKLFLELDYYDFHTINKKDTYSNSNIWKINLMGGGRIGQIIERLKNLRTLNSFLNEKKKEGWVHGDGFKVEGKERFPSSNITGKDFLPTAAFREDGIDWTLVKPSLETNFERPRNAKIYTPPHILLKPIVGKNSIPVHYSNRYLVFKSKIVGIHAPLNQENQLKILYNYFLENSDILRFYIACTSSQQMVNRATASLNEDLMNLPYPENLSDLIVSKAEKIIIDDVLKYLLSNWNELLKITTLPLIENFSKTFCQTLNIVYKEGNTIFRLFKILDAGKYFALHFEYTDNTYKPISEQTSDLEYYIKQIIPTEKNKSISTHTQRILKVYGKNTIIIAKPKQMRYWLQSIALRDADEIFSDYIKARYY